MLTHRLALDERYRLIFRTVRGNPIIDCCVLKACAAMVQAFLLFQLRRQPQKGNIMSWVNRVLGRDEIWRAANRSDAERQAERDASDLYQRKLSAQIEDLEEFLRPRQAEKEAYRFRIDNDLPVTGWEYQGQSIESSKKEIAQRDERERMIAEIEAREQQKEDEDRVRAEIDANYESLQNRVSVLDDILGARGPAPDGDDRWAYLEL